ncbi:SCO1 protein [Acephala macrosclerotiorum]|nr:SCO1 protein [Acephala macrosclerotiorum]
MSKPILHSRTLLSSFSRSLRTSNPNVKPQFFSARCQHLSTRSGSRVAQPARCLREGKAARIVCKAEAMVQKRGYKTVQEQRSRYRSGPFSALAGILFLSSGAGLILYFRYEKARMERKRIAEAAKGVGRPKVGGPFTLLDQNANEFSDERMKGRYSLVYFGFSHCPDICPEELDKMAVMIDLVNASPVMERMAASSDPDAKKILPLFITCDPARDTPAVLKEYLAEFHKDIVGLTGSWERIKDICKKYRVYFSTPENVKKGQDYLVDHSIYFYLMDPEGDFVEAIGRQHSPEVAASVILGHVGDWKR